MKINTIELVHDIQEYYIAGDWHSTHLHIPTFEILCAMALKQPKKNRRLIINGDFIDNAAFMPKSPDFKKWIKRTDGIELFFLPEYEAEVEWGNKMLDKLQEIFSEIIFIHGNHDGLRIDLFREKFCPVAYQNHFHLGASLQLTKRGIKEVQYNDWLDIGDISITHGMFHGPSAFDKHFKASGGRSCIFSHIHHDDKRSYTTRGKTRQVYSLPAMCELNPDYVRNQDLNWTNGFGKLIVKKSGHFNFHCLTVWDNELYLPLGEGICGETVKKELERPF